MRKVLATLTIIFSLSLMAGEAGAASFNIRQTSNLFKRMGCGYNPVDCVWCTQGGTKCYLVDKCTNGWCTVVDAPKNGATSPKPGIGPVGLKNPPTTVTDPTHPPSRPVNPEPVKPVGVSNPNKTDSGAGNPVIYERKNDSGGSQSGGHESGGGGGHGK